MWLQYDYGDGPIVDGVKTTLFCAWLAWSRFRVVIGHRDTPSAPERPLMAAIRESHDGASLRRVRPPRSASRG